MTTQRLAGLNVGSGTTALITPNTTAAVTTAALSVAATGKFDISNNKLVVAAGGGGGIGSWNGSIYTGVTGLIAKGRNGGNWSGNGIVTSQSQAIGSNYTSIGVARASDVRPSTATATGLWNGQTITGTDTLVMYTYGGDATLDGKLNIDDYVKIDSGIAAGLTGWVNGDFNYDGKVNIDDYTTVIDANIGNQGPPLGTSAGLGSGVSAIPEPGTAMGIGVVTAAAALNRRRRIR
jgi:hypothetical protein